MNRTRYVEVPADRFEAELEEIGTGVEGAGGSYRWTVQGRERVFEIEIPGYWGAIRIFTSLGVGAATVRDCGADAVRIVVGAVDGNDRFRPVEKGVKILRTAPRNGDRVGTFLARFREAVRAAYCRGRAIRPCPTCGAWLARRDGSRGPFLGCLSFPKCHYTERARS